MAKDKLLLYSPIYSYAAESLVEKMFEIDVKKDLDIYINSPGGSVFAGWGIIGALNERTGKKTAKVMGDASSMALFMLAFFDKVESIDVSKFILHRADGEIKKEEDRAFLTSVNNSLREKFEARIDEKKLKEITKYDLNDVFDETKRINVLLDAKQAKEIGLIDEIIYLGKEQLAALNEKFVAIADFGEQGSELEAQGSEKAKSDNLNNNHSINKKNSKMTKAELKVQYPDLYTEIYNEGVTDEKDRIEAFMEFADIDIEAVKKEIKEGKDITRKFHAEMSRKAYAVEILKATTDEQTKNVTTAQEEQAVTQKTPKEIKGEAEFAKFEADAMAAAGLTTEKKKEVKQ